MKTAGLILDFYDDPSFLKKTVANPEELPEIIKNAHILSSEERDVLRNEAYALVMVDEGKVFRKFACVDAGNTALSVLYFANNHDKLPEEAQKLAAANLEVACEEFGLNFSWSDKTAGAKNLVRIRDSFKQPMVGDEADWSQRTNLQSIRGGSDSSRVMSTTNSMKTAAIVDVTGKDASHIFKKTASSRYALNNKYPLDSYADVQKAIQYFSENYTELGPEDRHVYCVKTASRATEIGLEIPELMARYGSNLYSPDLEAHLANRRTYCDRDFIPVYNELAEKRASIEPELFAELLTETDEAANLHWLWGGQVSDPYYATFGGISEKEKIATQWSWQSRTGDYVTYEHLMHFVTNARKKLQKHFSDDIVNALQKDPVAIFSSLPDTHKSIIARMALDTTGSSV